MNCNKPKSWEVVKADQIPDYHNHIWQIRDLGHKWSDKAYFWGQRGFDFRWMTKQTFANLELLLGLEKWKYYQAWVPGLTYLMVKHFREKLKSHRESQKGTRADAIIKIHHPPTHPPDNFPKYIYCCQ